MYHLLSLPCQNERQGRWRWNFILIFKTKALRVTISLYFWKKKRKKKRLRNVNYRSRHLCLASPDSPPFADTNKWPKSPTDPPPNEDLISCTPRSCLLLCVHVFWLFYSIKTCCYCVVEYQSLWFTVRSRSLPPVTLSAATSARGATATGIEWSVDGRDAHLRV